MKFIFFKSSYLDFNYKFPILFGALLMPIALLAISTFIVGMLGERDKNISFPRLYLK